MMDKTVITLSLALLLGGCGGASKSDVLNKVANKFFEDPKEVRFSEVHGTSFFASLANRGGKVCGFAEGKTRFDDYTGPRPFIADENGGFLFIMTLDDEWQFPLKAARDCPTPFVNELIYHGNRLSQHRTGKSDNRASS